MFARQNWYIAARSHEVGARPFGRKLVNEDVVLFRTATGAVHALGARCAHRGGNLGGGCVVGETLQCPWHGWRYDAGGRCVDIPSLGPDGKIPGLAKVPSYPVHEAQGYIYLWMNPDVKPGWRPVTHDFLDAHHHVQTPVRFQHGAFINTVEAACDDSHVFIAHAATIGQGAPAHLAPVTDVRELDDGHAVEGTMVWPQARKRSFNGLNAWYQKTLIGVGEDSATHDRSYRVELSGLVIHTYRKADGNDFVVYAGTTPADENSNWFFAGLVDTNPVRPLLGNLLYWLNRKSASRVFDEDEDMITAALTPAGGHPQPISVNADAMGLAFRRIYARQVEAEGFVPAWPAASRASVHPAVQEAG